MSIQYHKCNQNGCAGYIAFENADFDYKEALNNGQYVLDNPKCSECGKEFRVVIGHVLFEYDEANDELIRMIPETGLSARAQDALERIKQGKSTCNQIRIEFGLEPLEGEQFDKYIKRVQRGEQAESGGDSRWQQP